LFDDDLLEALYPKAAPRRPEPVAQAYAQLQAGRDPVQAALATDRITYLPGDLLTKLDRSSMLHALEVRSPFMDHELVRLAAGLSTARLLGGGPKRMLRQAFAGDLPPIVFRRRKMGFALPIGDWLRQSLRPMMEDLLGAGDSFAARNFQRSVLRKMIDQHCSGRVDHSQRLYALVMLELWWKDRVGG
jgi:asparagine synthase (glutamine-hydrolysing)